MRILVTGGAGYIGSHTCVALAEAGHDVTLYDNFCNSSPRAVARIEELAPRRVQAVEGDIRDRPRLEAALAGMDAVIHFAALKAVGESCAQPLRYFDNNIGGTIVLLQAMAAAGVGRLVFSSSATVYGDAEQVPVAEDAPLSVTNPYGRTKLVMEQLIGDVCAAEPAFRAVLLRYFNPVGAHPSGRIGEDPRGEPANVMPYITQVAIGRRPELRIFGGDWPTPDGTGVRDYIHVMDLALAHVRAVELESGAGCRALNLGTGQGHSVLELVRAFEQASGRQVPYRIVDRRPGDVAALWADPAHAEAVLGWRAGRSLAQMCADAWRWQQASPDGYT